MSKKGGSGRCSEFPEGRVGSLINFCFGVSCDFVAFQTKLSLFPGFGYSNKGGDKMHES